MNCYGLQMHTKEPTSTKLQSLLKIRHSGCDHNQMSQQWQRTQKMQSILWSISVSHRKSFWDEIVCNMLLKIHIIFSIHNIICINVSWLTKKFLKMYKYYQILRFILKCGFHVLEKATKNMIIFIVKVEIMCVSMNFHRMCNYLYL
jgi:hypothetical protein